jgi:glucosyl-3-phosphoglycerate synthase
MAVVPAHDEEATVAATVKGLLSIRGVDEVVVVADGCTDRTGEEASGAGAIVLRTSRRLGKGRAIEGALRRLPGADLYLLVDGDTGDTAVEGERLLDEIRAGRLDVAIGVLPAQEGGGLGIIRRMATALIKAVTGFRSEAPLSGQRALTAEALAACRPLAAGFGIELGMTVDAVRLGLRVGEVPVAMRHRTTGRTLPGFFHRGLQGFDILRAMVPRALGLR